MLWHSRLGHVNHHVLSKLQDLVDGVSKLEATGSFYEPCIVAKLPRNISYKTSMPTTKKLVLVHPNVGVMPKPSVRGNKYYVTFIDNFKHYYWTYVMKNKSNVESVFKSLKLKVEHELECKLRCFELTEVGSIYC